MSLFTRFVRFCVLLTALATAATVRRNPGDFGLKAVNLGGTTLGWVTAPSYNAVVSSTTPHQLFYLSSTALYVRTVSPPYPGYPDSKLFVNFLQTGVSTCATSGDVVSVQGSSSNKCAKYTPYDLGGPGGSLRYGGAGTFLVCGSDNHVAYQASLTPVPSGCAAVTLQPVY